MSVVDSGQEVDLLDALAEPDAEEAARPERDQRLDGLEAGSSRDPPRDRGRRGGAHGGTAPARSPPWRDRHDPRGAPEDAHRRPGDDEHRGDGDDDRDRRSQVGLREDERADGEHGQPDGLQELPERLRRPAPAQVAGEPEHDGELGELGRLEVDHAHRQPAAGAVHGRADHEHGDEQTERREEERPARVAERTEVHAREHRERRPGRSRRRSPGASGSRRDRPRRRPRGPSLRCRP